MRSDPRIDVLQASVVAMAAALSADQAAIARVVMLAGVADLESRDSKGANDAAAAGALTEFLGALARPTESVRPGRLWP